MRSSGCRQNSFIFYKIEERIKRKNYGNQLYDRRRLQKNT